MSPVCATATDTNLAVTSYFSVHARAMPGVMPRVLELFAKRGLVPTVWRSAIDDADRADLTIDIEMVGLDREVTRYLAACLRQIADVETVLTTEREAASAGPRSG
jgi:acetolactate synthase regulatory subunit